MLTTYALVMIWHLGGAGQGQRLVIPGFSSQETCEAAGRDFVNRNIPMTRYLRGAPAHVLCIEVK